MTTKLMLANRTRRGVSLKKATNWPTLLRRSKTLTNVQVPSSTPTYAGKTTNSSYKLWRPNPARKHVAGQSTISASKATKNVHKIEPNATVRHPFDVKHAVQPRSAKPLPELKKEHLITKTIGVKIKKMSYRKHGTVKKVPHPPTETFSSFYSP